MIDFLILLALVLFYIVLTGFVHWCGGQSHKES